MNVFIARVNIVKHFIYLMSELQLGIGSVNLKKEDDSVLHIVLKRFCTRKDYKTKTWIFIG